MLRPRRADNPGLLRIALAVVVLLGLHHGLADSVLSVKDRTGRFQPAGDQPNITGRWRSERRTCQELVYEFDGRNHLMKHVRPAVLTDSLIDTDLVVRTQYAYELLGTTLTVRYPNGPVTRTIVIVEPDHLQLKSSRPGTYIDLYRCGGTSELPKGQERSKDVVNWLESRDAITKYHDHGMRFSAYLQRYDYLGDYLNYSVTGSGYEQETDMFRTGPDGAVRVRHGDTWYFNPITASHQALHYHGIWVKSGKQEAKTRFLEVARAIVRHQDDRGGFP